MKNLEKKIEDAAEKYCKCFLHTEFLYETNKKSFINGVLSPIAEELHTHTLKIEMIAKCAKMQVELKKDLYTEEEVMEKVLTSLNERYGILDPKRTISEILKQTLYTKEEVIELLHNRTISIFAAAGYTHQPSFSTTKEWFRQNKKK